VIIQTFLALLAIYTFFCIFGAGYSILFKGKIPTEFLYVLVGWTILMLPSIVRLYVVKLIYNDIDRCNDITENLKNTTKIDNSNINHLVENKQDDLTEKY